MTIDFETYLRNIKNIVAWFDDFAAGGGEAMIAETTAFILEAPYNELSRTSHFPIDRAATEAALVDRCRQYPVSTYHKVLEIGFREYPVRACCRGLLELGFLIDNLHVIIEARRKKEQEDHDAMCDDLDSRWSDLDDHEVDDGETVPADPRWAEDQEY